MPWEAYPHVSLSHHIHHTINSPIYEKWDMFLILNWFGLAPHNFDGV